MSQQYPHQPQQPGWHGGPPTPGAPTPQPPKKRAGKIVGFGCLGAFGLLFLIGLIGVIADRGDTKNAPAATASPEPTAVNTYTPKNDDDKSTPTTAPTTTAPKPTASKPPTPDAPAPGGDVASWVSTMTGHGATWVKKGTKETIPGLPPTLNWFGETKGATSFTANAITDTNRRVLSLSCNAAGIPKGNSAGQVALFTDCITAADLDIDNAKVRNWIKTKLPAMLAKNDMQIENLELGTASLSMDTAGNTAAITFEQE
ncbi:hypothetical protein [Streptomyces sp. PTD5-9]|uniref:hypothetical protein n=1 Tax=Streptomyces sp. PTD5-9 TaxID=3120150 RepID=UPI003009DE73